jgi:hypothetical protein
LALYSETRRLLGDDYEFFWAEIDDVEKVVVKNYILEIQVFVGHFSLNDYISVAHLKK